MHRPVIADCSLEKRNKLIETILDKKNDLNYVVDDVDREVVASAVNFYNELEQELKSSTVTTAQIKKLLGVYEEKIKKLTRNQ